MIKTTNNNKFCVYKHTSPNNKVYIGVTSTNPLVRWNNGLGYKNNKYFFNAILKYGWNNFTHEILYTDLTESEACEKEIELISYYKSNQFEYGYNRSSGGEKIACGVIRTEEERKRMSDAHKGQVAWNKGKKASDEVKKKLSESHKLIFIGGNNPHAKKVGQYNIDDELIKVWDCITEACKELDIQVSSVSFCISGKYKTAGGYKWKLVKEGGNENE